MTEMASEALHSSKRLRNRDCTNEEIPRNEIMPRKLCEKMLTSSLGNDIIMIPSKLGKNKRGVVMKKEEVLEKSRKQGDEMVSFVRDKSMKWTYITMVLFAAIFAFIRAENGDTMMDLCTTLCASVAVGHIYRFIKTKDKSYLILGIITTVVGAFALVRFIMGY